jgi:Domain of Unknown Function (DUF1080)
MYDGFEARASKDSPMRQICSAVLLAVIFLTPTPSIAAAAPPFSGRWDLTITTSKGEYPSWMEFADEDGTPAVRIVGRTGSVHPVTNAKVDGTRLTFEDGPGHWEMTVKDRKLTGQSPGGSLSGVPAPRLAPKAVDAWTDPQPLFDGHDLTGWEPDNASANHWIVENGELRNVQAGANIRSTRKFSDFKLHIEYNCPQGGNSGVYLRGRYEIQVEYEPPGQNDVFHSMGSIYGFIPPARTVDPRPGQWESYDAMLIGRNVTVIRDGALIIDNAEIPGITGGALDSHEGEPGPIYLQGDHTGGLKYRKITISVPR